MRYYALIRKEPDSDYGVEFPDFPGCITVGKDLDEAARLAEEALNFHIDGLLEDGEPLPDPSPLGDIEVAGAVPFVVQAHGRAKKRINIMLPVWLVEQIDNAAYASGTSRSGLIEEAAKEKLTGMHG
ncbi:MAG: type II toxin-antitoxin system HicB family antitoxin [Nitrospinota bacterium]